MISDARGGHVSPGIYTEEKDVTYSVKSLGITSLGLVGETLKGPAFQNIEIEDWGDFVDYFGGTSPEKFKGNGRPKYELPYIAKEYLKASKRLNVVRVLGLSGYEAGPVWGFSTSTAATPVVLLRSKMTYNYNATDACSAVDDVPDAVVKSIEYMPYNPISMDFSCAGIQNGSAMTNNYKFGIKVTCNKGMGYKDEYIYNVSLNSLDNDYIYSVLPSEPSDSCPIYIDAVYENAFDGNAAISRCDSFGASAESIYFKCVSAGTEGSTDVTYYWTRSASADGATYNTDVYEGASAATAAYGSTAYISGYTGKDSIYSDFTEQFRCALTPWIVSNVAATSSNTEVTATMSKLFRFYTISDGNESNFQVKISICNIRPEDGTFDVWIRDYNDTDINPVVLEKYTKCTMVEGDTSFIGAKIGTYDGVYEAKSKYVTVEVNENEGVEKMVPAGYLGYPMPQYGSHDRLKVAYNQVFNASVAPKRQYFGLNKDILDSDILTYKGKSWYDEDSYLTNGFHLDSVLSLSGFSATTNVFVDGVSGYQFTTVSAMQPSTSSTRIPRILTETYMNDTIYADKSLRKFTVYTYGGFDGWDVNRTERTVANNYKASKYNVKGSTIFTSIDDNGLNAALDLHLPSTAITTDYYAYLAGYKQFANPQDVDINVFATPGIDWYNETLLTEDALDVIVDKEDGRGGDALYVMITPQYDENGDSFTYDEIIDALEADDIDTSYACTFYPWAKCYDSSNAKYIDLSVTKDVVRNFANTDNNQAPWFAAAGYNRGDVSCVKAVHKTTLAEEDALYEAGINPVKSFSQDGVKVWGNKTLYQTDSPLNRINVRRLMIRVKKLVVDASKTLLFDQYDDTVEQQFKGLVDPILADVKSKRGIYDYRIITEVTSETRDQHILPAKILIKPTPTLEYISISFVVYPESVEFED